MPAEKNPCPPQSKLATLFVASLLAAPLARAQDADVTLYGRVNVDMEVVNGKQAGRAVRATARIRTSTAYSNSSQCSESAGPNPSGSGVSAIFQIESGLFDDRRPRYPGQPRNVPRAVRAAGNVQDGLFLGPYDDILPIFGNVPTLTTSILSTAALWAQGFLGPPEAGGFDDRLRQSIRYDTPRMSGFNASLQYASYEGLSRPHSNTISTGAFYNNGPVQLGIAYERHDRIRGTPAEPLTDQALSVAGSYQFELVRIGAVYERLQYEATSTTNLKRNFYGIGATADVGPGLLYAFVGRAGNGTGSAVDGTRIGGLTKGKDTGSTQWAVSYTYVMSGRTLAYAGYVKIRNDSNAAYTFNQNPYPILCNVYPNGACGKPGGFVLGMAHFF